MSTSLLTGIDIRDYKQEQGYGFYRRALSYCLMLVVDGFAPGIVIAAASQNRVDFGTPEELEKLMAQVTKVADQYQENRCHSHLLRRQFGRRSISAVCKKEYMGKPTQDSTLRDDEIITTKIYNELYTLSRSDMPQDMEEDKAKENPMTRSKPFCREALESGSPTASRAGTQYSISISRP